MVGANVSAMEEQVTEVEGEVGTIPGAFKKIFRTMSVPGFLNVSIHIAFNKTDICIFIILIIVFFSQKPASPKRQSQRHQDLPSVFRTEDYFKPQPEQ